MRHAHALVIGLALLGLSACREAKTDGVVAETQSLGAKICKFVPAANTILGILATGRPDLASAGAIASAICGAIASQPRAGGLAEPPTVAGVVVRGQRIP